VRATNTTIATRSVNFTRLGAGIAAPPVQR
jgi:hypothetical protein